MRKKIILGWGNPLRVYGLLGVCGIEKKKISQYFGGDFFRLR